jgi:ketosteroid isomerase-like protein
MTDIKNFLRQFNDLWVVPDVEAIVANVTDDIHFSMVGKPPIVGKADFRKMFDDMSGHSSDMSMEVEHVLVDGDRAMVNGLIHMPGDGGQKTYAFCDVYRLEGARVAELKAYVVETDSEQT